VGQGRHAWTMIVVDVLTVSVSSRCLRMVMCCLSAERARIRRVYETTGRGATSHARHTTCIGVVNVCESTVLWATFGKVNKSAT
jgi:hypothetical protein